LEPEFTGGEETLPKLHQNFRLSSLPSKEHYELRKTPPRTYNSSETKIVLSVY